MNCKICGNLTPDEDICAACEFLDDSEFKKNEVGMFEAYVTMEKNAGGEFICGWPSINNAAAATVLDPKQISEVLVKCLIIPLKNK